MNRARMLLFFGLFTGFISFCYAEVDPDATISFTGDPVIGGDGAKNDATVTGTGTWGLNLEKFAFDSADIRIFNQAGTAEIRRGKDIKGTAGKWTAVATKLGKGKYKAACALVYHKKVIIGPTVEETFQNPVSVDIEIK